MKDKIIELRKANLSIREIAKKLNISKSKVQRIIKKWDTCLFLSIEGERFVPLSQSKDCLLLHQLSRIKRKPKTPGKAYYSTTWSIDNIIFKDNYCYDRFTGEVIEGFKVKVCFILYSLVQKSSLYGTLLRDIYCNLFMYVCNKIKSEYSHNIKLDSEDIRDINNMIQRFFIRVQDCKTKKDSYYIKDGYEIFTKKLVSNGLYKVK